MDNIDLNTLIKKYNRIYETKISPENWSESFCLKLMEVVKRDRKKMVNENYYKDIVNNKEYFKLILLESICKKILTEIYTTNRKIRKRGFKKWEVILKMKDLFIQDF